MLYRYFKILTSKNNWRTLLRSIVSATGKIKVDDGKLSLECTSFGTGSHDVLFIPGAFGMLNSYYLSTSFPLRSFIKMFFFSKVPPKLITCTYFHPMDHCQSQQSCSAIYFSVWPHVVTAGVDLLLGISH